MNWISVAEKLPKDHQLVNICIRKECSEKYYTARFHEFCHCFQFRVEGMTFTFESDMVAFWKPLESLEEEYERESKKILKNFDGGTGNE